MSDNSKVYIQSEVDAFIAGARIEEAKWEHHPLDECKRWSINQCLRCERIHELEAATPDAARLALEEREKQLTGVKITVEQGAPPNASPPSWQTREYFESYAGPSEVEARLEEAEWWAAQGDNPCTPWVDRGSVVACVRCRRLAAHRATVQEKGTAE